MQALDNTVVNWDCAVVEEPSEPDAVVGQIMCRLARPRRPPSPRIHASRVRERGQRHPGRRVFIQHFLCEHCVAACCCQPNLGQCMAFHAHDSSPKFSPIDDSTDLHLGGGARID